MTAPSRRVAPTPDVLLLVLLYLLGASAWLAASARGTVSLGAALVLLVAASAAGYRYLTEGRRDRRRFAITVVLAAVPAVLCLAAGEVAVRLLARSTPRGVMVAGTILLPHQWSDVVKRNAAILERVGGTSSFLVADADLGWVVGRDRRSADGLYFSSAEGIRSPGPAVAFAERSPRRRVVLVGDSFTFGLDVSFEDSWGHRLEQALGADVQVLNFGVQAYGVDQAVLRYERDARQWRPDVVILGLIDHDLSRSMSVYFFVSFPGWEYPFAKPRFVMEGDRLALLNVPVLSPRAILAAPSIRDLPFIEYEPGYRAEEWEWRALDHSYLHRLVVSAARGLWSAPRAAPAEIFRLNRALVRSFIQKAQAEGSAPLIVYFPSDRNFRALARDPGWRSLAQTMLTDAGIPHLDMTSCLAGLRPAERFPADGRNHYAPPANAAVAACLGDSVRRLLSERPPRADEGGRERRGG